MRTCVSYAIVSARGPAKSAVLCAFVSFAVAFAQGQQNPCFRVQKHMSRRTMRAAVTFFATKKVTKEILSKS
jgi:hypothetical protein